MDAPVRTSPVQVAMMSLTFLARHKCQEEQHQLPPLENVSEDQGTAQAGLNTSAVKCITLHGYPTYGGLLEPSASAFEEFRNHTIGMALRIHVQTNQFL